MTLADDIREHVKKNYIDPARRRGERTVTFRASDIHRAMGLQNHFPSVCQAIDSDKFIDFASVALFKRTGPPKSSSVRWTFDLLPHGHVPILSSQTSVEDRIKIPASIEFEKQGYNFLSNRFSKSVGKDGEVRMKKIVLISCVKSKLNVPAKAKDLYVSPLFAYLLKYARQLKPDAVYILSAKYGLLELEQIVAPYEMTLNKMGEPEKKAWARRVLESLIQKTDLKSDQFIFLAGRITANI